MTTLSTSNITAPVGSRSTAIQSELQSSKRCWIVDNTMAGMEREAQKEIKFDSKLL